MQNTYRERGAGDAREVGHSLEGQDPDGLGQGGSR